MPWLQLIDDLNGKLVGSFLSPLRLGRIFLFSVSLDPIESPVHVVVLEVCACFGALVLLAGVVVEVDSLVVEQLHGSIVLLCLGVLPAVVLLHCLLIHV